MRFKIVLAILVLVAFSPSNLFSAEQAKTQGQFAEKLVEVIGISGELPKNPSQDDCAKLLTSKGIEPEGGYRINQPITEDEISYLLSNVMGIDKIKAIQEENRGKIVIEKVIGDVKVKKGDAGDWITAETRMVLTVKDTVKTGKDSTATLRAGVISVIFIKPDSEVSISNLISKPSEKREDIVIYLNVGEILIDAYNMNKESNFQVITSSTLCAVRGTIYSIKRKKDKTKADDLMK